VSLALFLHYPWTNLSITRHLKLKAAEFWSKPFIQARLRASERFLVVHSRDIMPLGPLSQISRSKVQVMSPELSPLGSHPFPILSFKLFTMSNFFSKSNLPVDNQVAENKFISLPCDENASPEIECRFSPGSIEDLRVLEEGLKTNFATFDDEASPNCTPILTPSSSCVSLSSLYRQEEAPEEPNDTSISSNFKPSFHLNETCKPLSLPCSWVDSDQDAEVREVQNAPPVDEACELGHFPLVTADHKFDNATIPSIYLAPTNLEATTTGDNSNSNSIKQFFNRRNSNLSPAYQANVTRSKTNDQTQKARLLFMKQLEAQRAELNFQQRNALTSGREGLEPWWSFFSKILPKPAAVAQGHDSVRRGIPGAFEGMVGRPKAVFSYRD
jgi:hypothetical protein